MSTFFWRLMEASLFGWDEAIDFCQAKQLEVGGSLVVMRVLIIGSRPVRDG